jgi:histone acetyltransferase HTATIP/histone acetyltransferase MYST1
MAGGLNRSEKMSTLFVCGLCFKYMGDATSYERHRLNCNVVCPPGRRIYQRGAHTIWEVDGAVQKVRASSTRSLLSNSRGVSCQLYCQNLSLFGKLFIDVKTLFFDCDNCTATHSA